MPENEVHAILRQNVAHDRAAGWFDVKPPAPRKSRRLRDYLLLLIPVNTLFVVASVQGFRTGNAILFGFGLGGFIFYTLALSWVIWVLMDPY